MSADIEVEAAEAVAAEGVGAALDDDCGGVVVLDAGADYVSEEARIAFIVDAVVERDVEGVVRAGIAVGCRTCFVEPAGAGKEDLLIVFVERQRHHTIGGPESLFDAVAMVDVDVYVEDSRVVEEKLEDGEDDVVDIAESAGFSLFSVVQTAGPINGDVGLFAGEFAGCVEGGAGVEGAIFEEAVEDGAIIAHVERVEAIRAYIMRLVGMYAVEEIDVVTLVEGGQFCSCCCSRYVCVHSFVHAICHDDLVCQGESPWLHGVVWSEMRLLDRLICMV